MKNKDVLEEPGLLIKGNIIQVGDSVIQLRNISKIQVGPIPKAKFPLWALGVFLLSIYALKEYNYSKTVLAIACVGLIASVIVLCMYVDNPNKYYLSLHLNSGSIMYISSHNSRFLKEGQEVITNCFNGLLEKNSSYVVNFKDCTVTQSQFGENNKINF